MSKLHMHSEMSLMSPYMISCSKAKVNESQVKKSHHPPHSIIYVEDMERKKLQFRAS